MKNDDYKRFREHMIGAILATDMSFHFKEFGGLKVKVESDNFEISGKDKYNTLYQFFHFADISNTAKPFDICRKWTENLFYGEFFIQGDLERSHGQEISQLMDRQTTNIAKA
jgi:hypothetical protein